MLIAIEAQTFLKHAFGASIRIENRLSIYGLHQTTVLKMKNNHISNPENYEWGSPITQSIPCNGQRPLDSHTP